jgi:hypothetical protein
MIAPSLQGRKAFGRGWLRKSLLRRPRPIPLAYSTAITAAVAWRFTQHVIADLVPAGDFPRLVALSARAEALPPFRETDYD